MFSFDETKLKLSGERFSVIYKIIGNEQEAQVKAQEICFAQTVNLLPELVPQALKDTIVGQLETFAPWGDNSFKAIISYAVEAASNEFTQLLNVIFGNNSLRPGVRVEELILPPVLLKNFQGPRFGREGLRKLLKIKDRPLLATTLTPLGLSPEEFAELAYKLALGGMDIIMDNPNLANQSFSPFEKRVKLCAQAVRRANKETGKITIYAPNITTNYLEVRKRGDLAVALGAGGLLLAPGLVGFDALKTIAEDEQLGIPVFAQPALLGSYVFGDSGISHYALFGQLARLAGADAVLFPNYGGKSAFSKADTLSIAQGTNVPLGNLKANFPCPAEGSHPENLSLYQQTYGNEVIFSMGAELFRHDTDLIESCRYFRKVVERH